MPDDNSHRLARLLQDKWYLARSCNKIIICENLTRSCKIAILYRLGPHLISQNDFFINFWRDNCDDYNSIVRCGFFRQPFLNIPI